MKKFLLLLIILTCGVAHADTIDFGGTLVYPLFQQTSKPSSPPSGYNYIYFKSDNILYTLTSAGTETAITAGADVLSVGDCASGACLDGTSDGGTYISLYGGALTKKTSLYAGNSAADLSFYLPTTAGAQGGDTLLFCSESACYPRSWYSRAVLKDRRGSGWYDSVFR